jgi:hypothetical protein
LVVDRVAEAEHQRPADGYRIYSAVVYIPYSFTDHNLPVPVYKHISTKMGGNISTLGQTQGGRVAGVVGFT